MWAKGSNITQATNSRGTSKNLHFCRESIYRAVGKSERKLMAVYSFCITCLPMIPITKDLEKYKYTDSEDCLKFLIAHSELHILVWFLVQLKFDWAVGMSTWADEIAKFLDVQVNGGHFRPETSLKKVQDLIARMPTWKKAGLESDVLAQIAEDIEEVLAYRIAHALDKKYQVSIRPYTLLIIRCQTRTSISPTFISHVVHLSRPKRNRLVPVFAIIPWVGI
jgi:hypothetical protein